MKNLGSIAHALRITEIFYSLQGESRTVGLLTAFIRLTGCPLRCGYCDTSYAFQGGRIMAIDEILTAINEYEPRYITVTGGEPLAQPNCLTLLTVLCNQGYEVSIETSGALPIQSIDQRVVIVMDIKTPGSQEVTKNNFTNIDHLTNKDQIKFVICDEKDYLWARNMMTKYRLADRCEILFSPSYQQLSNQTLADWIIRDNLPVRFQVQLHKYIWGEVAGK